MKSLKILFILLVALLIPVVAFAEDEDTDAATTEDGEVVMAEEGSNEVNVYFFRGEGCSHCAEAEAWFESIEEEYGSKFKIVDYETWYNSENAELMQKVAKARGETAEGVPYIIVGNKSWNGFAEDYADEILAQIESEFETNVDERYDIMKLMETGGNAKVDDKDDKKSNDALSLIIIIVAVGAICFGVYKASNSVN
ncbi:MAG: hypothetical protein IJJ63_02950 [Bacilli bacterium]|nr:hypothetical protein [Bacilli bacterium]